MASRLGCVPPPIESRPAVPTGPPFGFFAGPSTSRADSRIRPAIPPALPVVFTACLFAAGAFSADWPEGRGPTRDGRSPETGLPESWSPDGENLLFRAPYGGRSTPVILGGRLFLQTAVGEGETRQARLLALDAGTGELLWEERRNIYHSDAPPRRVGWASPAADAETGTVFWFTVGGGLSALAAESGNLRWERSLPEELGLVTTHGGRTASPLILGDLVILSGLTSSWGAQARGSQRFFAFDKRTGEIVWLSTPGGRPFDTTYSPALVRKVAGQRLLLVGGGDGAFHAIQPTTGASVWRFPMSKRGVNSGAVVFGNLAVVSHGEENLESSQMGLLAALDARSSGEIARSEALWEAPGFMGGYSSGVGDGEILYQLDNSANLTAFSANDGAELWSENLGTIQRASPVLADGKLYVGTANGRFFILRPGREGVLVLDDDRLGTESALEEILASAAISDGVVYLVSTGALYAIGERRPTLEAPPEAPIDASSPEISPEAPSPPVRIPVRLLVSPTEEILAPGDEVPLTVRAFDELGDPVDPPAELRWSVAGFDAEVRNGTLSVGADAPEGAGTVIAAAGAIEGAARFRVVPPLPWHWDFDGEDARVPPQWVNAAGKYETRTAFAGEREERVLVKKADNPFLRRARVYMGAPTLSGYTVSADVLAKERRRQLGNAGLVAQRYQFVLMGSHQRLEIHSWQATPGRTVQMPFAWEPDTWYSMKFQVVEDEAGTVARGKVWQRSEPEPEAWTLDWREPLPHREGTPGIFADAVTAEVFFDNIRVEPGNPPGN